MRKTNIITGIGFFTTLIGFGGLAESFNGNGKTSIAMIIVAIGILMCASQTIREGVASVKEDMGINASYPSYLAIKRKRRR